MQLTDASPQLTAVCLIPARSGSKRITHKNIMNVEGHPLLAYTIRSAIESEQFAEVIVSTDDSEYAAIARHYGASVKSLRPKQLASDQSPDVQWIEHELLQLQEQNQEFDLFAILRPTNPFRSKNTINRAFEVFHSNPWAESLRAVERTAQHPGKMWVKRGAQLFPVLPVQSDAIDWFSSPTQSLPEIWVQNASLEISRVSNVLEKNSITGHRILGFETEGLEGFDINTPEDVVLLRHFIQQQQLPLIDVVPYTTK